MPVSEYTPAIVPRIFPLPESTVSAFTPKMFGPNSRPFRLFCEAAPRAPSPRATRDCPFIGISMNRPELSMRPYCAPTTCVPTGTKNVV